MNEIDINGNVISHVIKKPFRLENKPAIAVAASQEYQKILDQLAAAATTVERENLNVKHANFPDLDRYGVTVNNPYFIGCAS